jgi:hypothetical protein
MSDGDTGRWFDVDLAELSPEQRVTLDQALRAEAIPATWGGTVLRVDEAYEARLSTLVDEARAAPPPPPGAPPTTAPPTFGAPPAPYAPPGPGSPPVYPGGPGAPVAPTNSSAIISLVCGLVGLLTGCLPTGPVGLWFGVRARREIRERGEQGDGMAIAGLITSGIATLFLVAAVLFLVFVVLLGVLGSSSSS